MQKTESFILPIFFQTPCSLEHPATTDITIPNIKIHSVVLDLIAYCNPDDPYLRCVNCYFDSVGGPIGCHAIRQSQVRGDTFSAGQIIRKKYDLAKVEFANETTWKGSFKCNLISDEKAAVKFTAGIHTVQACVTSNEKYMNGISSWITMKLHINE